MAVRCHSFETSLAADGMLLPLNFEADVGMIDNHTTTLSEPKLLTVAAMARLLSSGDTKRADPLIGRQMLAEGVRKLHDHASFQEKDGKFLGHPHWSLDALRRLKRANGDIEQVKRQLRHEHVVPVGTVLDKLLGLGPRKTLAPYVRVIKRFSLVAIITREEDELFSEAGLARSMPTDWDGHDVWARYRAVRLIGRIRPRPRS